MGFCCSQGTGRSRRLLLVRRVIDSESGVIIPGKQLLNERTPCAAMETETDVPTFMQTNRLIC